MSVGSACTAAPPTPAAPGPRKMDRPTLPIISNFQAADKLEVYQGQTYSAPYPATGHEPAYGLLCGFAGSVPYAISSPSSAPSRSRSSAVRSPLPGGTQVYVRGVLETRAAVRRDKSDLFGSDDLFGVKMPAPT